MSGRNSDSQSTSAELFRPEPGWKPELTERLRVLLHARPLFDLRRSDSHRSTELRHYDSLTLAVRLWDLIVDGMGFDNEADRAVALRELGPMLTRMDDAAGLTPDTERHEEMVDVLIAALRNDSARRRPFAVPYHDFDEHGNAVERQAEFNLVRDHLHPAGGTVLRLSDAAVNLYLRAWDMDIEDAQAAAEAVVLSQLNRGRFDEAVHSARNSRLASLRFWTKVDRIIRDTRRDVHRVDWSSDVPRLLEDARLHIQTRTDMEANILSTARDRLDRLEPGEDGARAVAEVCRLIEECRHRHFELHGQLMDARNVFLDEQDRQAFQPQRIAALPALPQDVLDPLCRLPRREALTVLKESAGPLVGPVPPELVSLAGLVQWLLQPRRVLPSDETPLEQSDLADRSDELLRYPEHIRDRGEAILDEIDQPTRLSEVLSVVRDWEAPRELQEYLTLFSLEAFAPDNGSGRFDVQGAPDETLDVDGFFGDELILTPHDQAETKEHADV